MLGEARVSCDLGDPLEEHEEDESQDGGESEHKVPKNDVLRIMTCGLSDGSIRERLLLMLRNSLIVRIKRSQDSKRDVGDYQSRYVQTTSEYCRYFIAS